MSKNNLRQLTSSLFGYNVKAGLCHHSCLITLMKSAWRMKNRRIPVARCNFIDLQHYDTAQLFFSSGVAIKTWYHLAVIPLEGKELYSK